jgi:hypothetical protein
MDETRFWELIEEASHAAPGHDMASADRQAAALEKRLAELSRPEIVAFQEILDRKRDESYRWDLWGAAYLMNGGCSDDCFDYFRGWLIGRGRKVFEAALRDPDSLADLAADPHAPDVADGARECERFLYVAQVAFEKTGGGRFPPRTRSSPREPAGAPWQEDDLPRLLPRIAQKVFATR